MAGPAKPGLAHSDSCVERVTFRGRETVTHLLTADNMSVRSVHLGADGALVVELFRYDDKTGRAVESYRFTYGPEDRLRLKQAL